MSNAIKYSSVDDEIKLISENESNHIILSVINKGQTIDEDQLDILWDAYYRIDSSRNRTITGFGLGLSIARDILDLHGFKYGCENTESGFRFFFSLNN